MSQSTVVRSEGGYGLANLAQITRHAASSSLREFRIGSCEKPSATQTAKPKLFQEDLVVRPPQVEQMGELANQRSFFLAVFFNVDRLYRRARVTSVRSW